MNSNRRHFIKKGLAGVTGLSIAGSAMASSAKNYSKIIGANDRLNIAIMGLGRRLGAYTDPISRPESNVELQYLCDVMKSQREKAAERFSTIISNKPALENDYRKILDDKKVDVVIVAAPDHWHTPATCMALIAGKHVYVEKPCSHNPWENDIIVKFQQKYGKVVQMGNQQRSAPESIEIVNEIHNGAIGTAYKAVAFYINSRGEVPMPVKQNPPEGLDWELFQGPAPRKDYEHDTWDYNWHWYGWDFGTAEMGNNATHELDVARWALQVDYPHRVDVYSGKFQYENDGWTMYDNMEALYHFTGNKTIKWEGQSRNGYSTFGTDRGTIIYGSKGSVFVDRGGYRLYDIKGKIIKEVKGAGDEAGTALGGGGGMTTRHVMNFLETIRGKETLRAPIADASKSQMLTHYANISSRIGKALEIDEKTGIIYDRDAMKLWKRTYEPGWEPKL